MRKSNKGGNKDGLGLYELITLPHWKYVIVIFLINFMSKHSYLQYMGIVIRWYLTF